MEAILTAMGKQFVVVLARGQSMDNVTDRLEQLTPEERQAVRVAAAVALAAIRDLVLPAIEERPPGRGAGVVVPFTRPDTR